MCQVIIAPVPLLSSHLYSSFLSFYVRKSVNPYELKWKKCLVRPWVYIIVVRWVDERWWRKSYREKKISLLMSTQGCHCSAARKSRQRGEKNCLWPRMTGLWECHSNCGAITGKRWWVIALRSMASPSWRTLRTLAHLWPNLWRWHLKCWFWSTYANCCNFPDEAPFWYLDVAKIVLHFLCGPLCHLHRVVSAQSATESRQNCKQIASDCQHCEKVNCLQIYLNHWPIFISYGAWYSWLLNWRPFLLCSALWRDGKQSLPNQLPFFFSSALLH